MSTLWSDVLVEGGGGTDLCGTLSSAMEFRVEGDIHFRMSTGIAAPTCRNNLLNSCVPHKVLHSVWYVAHLAMQCLQGMHDNHFQLPCIHNIIWCPFK